MRVTNHICFSGIPGSTSYTNFALMILVRLRALRFEELAGQEEWGLDSLCRNAKPLTLTLVTISFFLRNLQGPQTPQGAPSMPAACHPDSPGRPSPSEILPRARKGNGASERYHFVHLTFSPKEAVALEHTHINIANWSLTKGERQLSQRTSSLLDKWAGTTGHPHAKSESKHNLSEKLTQNGP